MSELTNLLFLRVAPAASSTQVDDDTGATYVFLEPITTPTGTFKARKVPRNLMRGDNQKYSRVVAGVEPPSLSFSTLLRGLNSNTGAAVTGAKQTELDPLLAALMGQAANGSTGTTAAESTTTTLVVASATGTQAADALLFQDDANADNEYIIRMVDSTSGTTLTLDRDWSGDIVTAGTVYGSIGYSPLPAVSSHTHLHFDMEWEGGRRKAYGCLPDLKINFPSDGGLITLDWTIAGTHWEDVADADPTYTAPTVGSSIPNIDASFWIGSTEYAARDHSISVTQTRAPRTTNSGPNGFAGFSVTDKTITWEFTLRSGASAPEAPDSLLNTLQGATAQDIAMQVGRTAGAAAYFRMPAADIDAEKVTIDGVDHIKCMATATRSAEASHTAPFYISLI